MAGEMGWGMEGFFFLILTKIDGIDARRSRLDALDARRSRRATISTVTARRVIYASTSTSVPGVCLERAERADSELANSLKDLGKFTERSLK